MKIWEKKFFGGAKFLQKKIQFFYSTSDIYFCPTPPPHPHTHHTTQNTHSWLRPCVHLIILRDILHVHCCHVHLIIPLFFCSCNIWEPNFEQSLFDAITSFWNKLVIQVLGTEELNAYLNKYRLELDPQLDALVGRYVTFFSYL